MKISEQRWEATEAFDGDMHIGAFVTCDDEEICLADTAELANAIAHLPEIVQELKWLREHVDDWKQEVGTAGFRSSMKERLKTIDALLERLGEKP